MLVSGTCVAGTISSLTNGTSDVAYFYDSFHRIAKSTSDNLDLNVKYTPTEQWTVTGDFGYTQATGNTQPQYFTEYDAPGAFDYDMRNGFGLTPIGRMPTAPPSASRIRTPGRSTSPTMTSSPTMIARPTATSTPK